MITKKAQALSQSRGAAGLLPCIELSINMHAHSELNSEAGSER